jgi:hypothetical protein
MFLIINILIICCRETLMDSNKVVTPMKQLSYLLRPISLNLSNYFDELNLNKAEPRHKPHFAYRYVEWDDRDENYGKTKGVSSDFIRVFEHSGGVNIAFVFNFIGIDIATMSASVKRVVAGCEPDYSVSAMYSIDEAKLLLSEFLVSLQGLNSVPCIIKKFEEVFLSTKLEESEPFVLLERHLLNLVGCWLEKHKELSADLVGWKEKLVVSKTVGGERQSTLPISDEIAELEERLRLLRLRENDQKRVIAKDVGYIEAKAQVDDLTKECLLLNKRISRLVKGVTDTQPPQVRAALNIKYDRF